MWDLPKPGIEVLFPAFAGILLNTGPPGKPTFFFVLLLFFHFSLTPPRFLSSSSFSKIAFSKVYVGDGWAPDPNCWCLSGGVKSKLCSHPDTLRIELVAGAELCQSKEIRRSLLRSRKTSLYVHVQEGCLGVKKGWSKSVTP